MVRITAMASSGVRLWIGTSTGVVLSIPFSSSTGKGHLRTISVHTNIPFHLVDGGKIEGRVQPQFLPVCDANSAQISYHGHKEEVKFFVSVPGRFCKQSLDFGEKQSVTDSLAMFQGCSPVLQQPMAGKPVVLHRRRRGKRRL